MERQIFILNRSTIAIVEEPQKTGGHGDEFEESPITFVGTNDAPLNAVKISMASSDLRDQILGCWRDIHLSAVTVQEI